MSASSVLTPTRGLSVMVYQDPIALTKPEGLAVITKVLRQEGWRDSQGRQIWRCKVRFRDDRCVYERDISQATCPVD